MARNSSKIYAVFGNPVGHSLSPIMHNAAFKRMKIDAHYVPFCVKNVEDAVRGIKGLDIRGVSVTIPFKTTVMPYLDEVDESSLRIGAVNTILNDGNGRLKGFNTDWIGLNRDLEESLEIRGKTFAILGAGGAARAAVFGILKEGGIPVIFNRTTETGEEVAREFSCPFYSLSEIEKIKADCLINTTSVGMAPDIEKSPLMKESLINFRWVVDIIYNPLKTKLLREAEEAGCTVLDGVGMFVHQGAEQTKIWMGMEPPRALMRGVVLESLKEHDGN
ncbi:MAG: shikimate dehydrogenase [Deltaproteobacteria bacterium]|nr:shikimate dehydrogenase [Deltaproteobacteria bacterium]